RGRSRDRPKPTSRPRRRRSCARSPRARPPARAAPRIPLLQPKPSATKPQRRGSRRRRSLAPALLRHGAVELPLERGAEHVELLAMAGPQRRAQPQRRAVEGRLARAAELEVPLVEAI